jgi:hypothetical protein
VAVNCGENSVTPLADVRRRVAFLAHGALRLVDGVQGAMQDIEGALARGQYGVAAFQARYVMLLCLSVRGLAHKGEVELDEGSVSFDSFAGVAPEDAATALTLANDGLDVNEHTAGAWLERVRAYVSDTEHLLGYDAPLPELRAGGGVGLIGLARRWGPLLEEFGLPGMLPSTWFPTVRPGA